MGAMKTPNHHAAAASEKLAFSVPEAASASSLGQTSIYKAIRKNPLKARKFGSRTIITRADLTSFLEKLSAKR
jgi:excisionase family DNA binding protein